VNHWLWAATALLVLLVPLGAVAVAASRLDALVASEAAGTLLTLALVCLAQGFDRSAYTVLGVVAAVLTSTGSVVYIRFFERELDP
jgi:multisubunit Na+/H+ antiporter MnhF subunit